MLIYAVDLGTTNLKVVLYDGDLRKLADHGVAAPYDRAGDRVEFDPEAWFDLVVDGIAACASRAAVEGAGQDAVVVLTGQAESLVLVGRDGRPLRAGISWLDGRSEAEAREIAGAFDRTAAFRVTGQPFATTTWPATKLLWLRRHEPGILGRAAKVLLLKDYMLLRLTGEGPGELSTRAFSYLFDIGAADYWDEMLAFCGVAREALPALIEPCGEVGEVLPSMRGRLPPARRWRVNAGALDHFAGMIGTGSYRPGVVSESAGSVLSLSLLLAPGAPRDDAAMSYHRGAAGDDFVLFDACDSGGIGLEWFRSLSGHVRLGPDLDAGLAACDWRGAPLFLPYLTGLNPPDFNAGARGAFVDLRLGHGPVDMVYAVMEGNAHLLRLNIDHIGERQAGLDRVVSTGGGARSAFWNQLKADVVRRPVAVPGETEATARGAAMIALAGSGDAARLAAVQAAFPSSMRPFLPGPAREERYARFRSALSALYPS